MKKIKVTLIVTQKVEHYYYYFLKERTPCVSILKIRLSLLYKVWPKETEC